MNDFVSYIIFLVYTIEKLINKGHPLNMALNLQKRFYEKFVSPILTYQTFILLTLTQNTLTNFTKYKLFFDIFLMMGTLTIKSEKIQYKDLKKKVIRSFDIKNLQIILSIFLLS